MKSKVIFHDKEVEKRANAFDKRRAEEEKNKKKEKSRKMDPIAHAHKESSKSPNKMFKESMKHFTKLVNKKK